MKTIPLPPGHAFPRFSATIAGVNVRFRLNWSTRHGYYSVDLHRNGGQVIALGRALHPDVDLLAGLNLGMGRIILEGAAPTVANLGVANKLRWYPDE